MASPQKLNSNSSELPNPVADPSLSGSRAPPAQSTGQQGTVRRFLNALGPGLITGASDDDPSGIGTYAMAGAALGYAALWMALVTFPLMAAVQFICAKVGMVTGKGLAGVLRQHYPRILLYPAVSGVMLANTINAGADLGAIAAGVNLLLPVPISVLIVPVALLIVVLQVWGSYRFLASSFKWLTLSLLAYIGAAFLAKPDLGSVLKGTFLPTIRLDSAYLGMLVAVLGTTISPYLFFWQANQEVEEKTSWREHRPGKSRRPTAGELTVAAWDVGLGMFFSNVVMYFIILATAATLHRAGRIDIQSAAEAADALRPLAGNAATVLMALGLIGTGVLAVPILTASGAYAVCEAFRWTCSLDAKPGRAKEFYVIITASTLVGLLINFLGINPLTALFWTAVINGFLAPPLLVLIMLIANNRAIMGKRVNGLPINLLGWATTLAMFAAAVGLICTWGQG